MWKLLEIRDFLTSSKHIHTVWGRALSIAVAHQAQPSLAAQEAYLTAFELIRFGVLTGSPFSKTYTRPLPDAKLQQHVTLVSRTMSLLPMSLKVGTPIYPYLLGNDLRTRRIVPFIFFFFLSLEHALVRALQSRLAGV
ncbi:hypothetical protein BC940DRAFT_166353 [Gongronella butleri]|nr:hypothetical protein BC940DRAFT_166353 [Gongronella butleri]